MAEERPPSPVSRAQMATMVRIMQQGTTRVTPHLMAHHLDRRLASQHLDLATAALLLPLVSGLLVLDTVPLRALHPLDTDPLLGHLPRDTEVRQDPHPEGMALLQDPHLSREATLGSNTTSSDRRKEVTQANKHIQVVDTQANNTHAPLEPTLIHRHLPLALLLKCKTTGHTSKVPIIEMHNHSSNTLSVTAKRKLSALGSITSDKRESLEGVSMT